MTTITATANTTIQMIANVAPDIVSADVQELVQTAIDDHTANEKTARRYLSAINGAIASGVNLTDTNSVKRHAAGLSVSNRRAFQSGLNIWITGVTDHLDANVTPDSWIETQAAKDRLNVLKRVIRIKAETGVKVHNWHGSEVLSGVVSGFDTSENKQHRDRVLIAIMALAGLRREEVTALRWSDIVENPDGKFLNVANGKGNKSRSIPLVTNITRGLDQILETWRGALKKQGKYSVQSAIVRRVHRSGSILAGGVSGQAIIDRVNMVSELHGITFKPHDLRRSCAQNWRSAGLKLERIQQLLGHSDINTTIRYLSLELTDLVE